MRGNRQRWTPRAPLRGRRTGHTWVMNKCDISRAGALLVHLVPAEERLSWAHALSAADGIEDVPAAWRERLLAAHRIRRARGASDAQLPR